MKKVFFFIFVLVSLVGQAETTKIADLFRTMPDSVLPLLTTNNRLDFIDYLENNMQARVRNRFDEYSEMTELKDTYLHIKISEASEVEIKLFEDTVNHESLICLIRSYSAPARESVVEFYNQSWERIDYVNVPRPSVETYWDAAPDSVQSDVSGIQAELKDLPLISICADKEEPILIYSLQTDELEKRERDLAKEYMHPVQYYWTGAAFIEKK